MPVSSGGLPCQGRTVVSRLAPLEDGGRWKTIVHFPFEMLPLKTGHAFFNGGEHIFPAFFVCCGFDSFIFNHPKTG